MTTAARLFAVKPDHAVFARHVFGAPPFELFHRLRKTLRSVLMRQRTSIPYSIRDSVAQGLTFLARYTTMGYKNCQALWHFLL